MRSPALDFSDCGRPGSNGGDGGGSGGGGGGGGGSKRLCCLCLTMMVHVDMPGLRRRRGSFVLTSASSTQPMGAQRGECTRTHRACVWHRENELGMSQKQDACVCVRACVRACLSQRCAENSGSKNAYPGTCEACLQRQPRFRRG